MLVMIDPYADRDERVYVVAPVYRFNADGAVAMDEHELPGRFAFIVDALHAYPGSRVSDQARRALMRAAARADLARDRARTRVRISTG